MQTKLQESNITKEDTVLFVHIPKTAGSTMVAIINPIFKGELRCPHYYTHELSGMSFEEIRRYRYYIGHFHYGAMEPLLPPGFLCFTILRNPVSQYISRFYHHQRFNNFKRFENQKAFYLDLINEIPKIQTMSLLEFVDNDSLKFARSSRNEQYSSLGRLFDLDPSGQFQVKFKTPDKWVDIEVVKQRLASMSCFGLTERFQDSLFLLCYTFGWEPILETQRLNANPNPTSHDKIDPETLQRIEAVNNFDMELYKFARPLFERRFLQMCHELLERYGDRTDAFLNPSLSQEVIIKLLKRHYQARRQTPNFIRVSKKIFAPLLQKIYKK